MTTSNPIPLPVIKIEQLPELTNFAMKLDPPSATLLVTKGERVIFDVTMPMEEMRRVLFTLHEGITNHMENL